MMVGAHRQTSTASAQRGAIPDSLATRGGTQKHSRLNRGGCRPPPHRAEPRLDSPAAMGGARQQGSLDVPVAATPRGATPRLACDGGRHAPASNRPDERRSRSPPHHTEPLPDSPVRWEARTGTHQHAITHEVAEVDAVALTELRCAFPRRRREGAHEYRAPPPASPRPNLANVPQLAPSRKREGHTALLPARRRPNRVPCDAAGPPRWSQRSP